MILISNALYFTLQKAESAFYNRSFLVKSTDVLNLYSLDDRTRTSPMRLSNESRIMVKKVWPLFVQAEGLRPAGEVFRTDAAMEIRIRHSGTHILVNDWQNGAQNLGILLDPEGESPFVDMQLEYFTFSYDGLNMQDIYNGTTAKAFICLDVDAVPYV